MSATNFNQRVEAQITSSAYLANAIASVNPQTAADYATTAKLPNSPIYSNGVAGVGATITTLTTNTPLTIDGGTPALLEKVFVKNEGDSGGLGAAKNGVYYVSQLAAVGLPWILTRALDYDQVADINETGAIQIINGTDVTGNKNTSWVLVTKIATIGTDALTYRLFDPSITVKATYQPTASLSITGGGTTTINAANFTFANFYASSNATATTIAYSNIVDGATVTIDYLKTTGSDLVITFPAGTVISIASDGTVVTNQITLSSTSAGRYSITIQNINGVYKAYIVQDVL